MKAEPEIRRFSGEYQFLSNFWSSPTHPIMYQSIKYSSVEHAYQAAKTLDPAERAKIRDAETAADAKRLGRRVKLRQDWESVKVLIMLDLLRIKFKNRRMRELLMETAGKALIEGNNWHDQYWGVCTCTRCGGKGQNWLGKLLMVVRDEDPDGKVKK